MVMRALSTVSLLIITLAFAASAAASGIKGSELGTESSLV